MPLSAHDLRTLDYSSILLMGEVAMDHPGLADLLVDRQGLNSIEFRYNFPRHLFHVRNFVLSTTLC